jgi:hypothetical protein
VPALPDAIEARHAIIVAAQRLAIDDAEGRLQPINAKGETVA